MDVSTSAQIQRHCKYCSDTFLILIGATLIPSIHPPIDHSPSIIYLFIHLSFIYLSSFYLLFIHHPSIYPLLLLSIICRFIYPSAIHSFIRYSSIHLSIVIIIKLSSSIIHPSNIFSHPFIYNPSFHHPFIHSSIYYSSPIHHLFIH